MHVNIDEKRRRILDIGVIGEQIARLIIKKFIKPKHIMQIDWMINSNDEWYTVEVKFKPKFRDCQSLSINQVKSRMALHKDKNIRCLLLSIEPKTKDVSIQWLDVLEETDYIDSIKNNTRLYNLKYFKNIGKYDEITGFNLEEIIYKYNKLNL